MNWISVKDESLIPKEGFRCLALYKGSFVCLMQYSKGSWVSCGLPGESAHAKDDNLSSPEFTHWMPLPIPPTGAP